MNRAAQHLTRLTLESSAQAALITRNDLLWAYAGQLPQDAAHELAESVARYWDRQEENDLVRFVRLESTNAEHMLYATRLADGMVLALVFDAETPFSTIHTQATQLVHSLSSSPVDEFPQGNQPGAEVRFGSLSGLFTDLPKSNPSPDYTTGSQGSFEVSDPGSFDGGGQSIPLRLNNEFFPTMQVNPNTDTDQAEYPPDPIEQAITPPAITRRNNNRRSAQESVDETRQRSTNQGTHRIVLEPVSSSLYNLDYACLLLPRFPHHYLTGEVLERLGEWIPQICIAYGWRLEYISVRPDYLQWIVKRSTSHLPRLPDAHAPAAHL